MPLKKFVPLVLLLAASARAELAEPQKPRPSPVLEKARAFLLKLRRADGSFAPAPAVGEDEGADVQYPLGAHALCTLALLHDASRGPSVEWLLKRQTRDGVFQEGIKERRFYVPSHILALLALAEASLEARPPPEAWKPAVGKAVKALLSAQRKDGSWNYDGSGMDSETWITALALTALERAKAGGAEIPAGAFLQGKAALERAHKDAGRFGMAPDPGKEEPAYLGATSWALAALQTPALSSDRSKILEHWNPALQDELQGVLLQFLRKPSGESKDWATHAPVPPLMDALGFTVLLERAGLTPGAQGKWLEALEKEVDRLQAKDGGLAGGRGKQVDTALACLSLEHALPDCVSPWRLVRP